MSVVSPSLAFRRAAHALVVVLLAGAASCDDTNLTVPMGPDIMLTPPNASIAVGDSAVFSATARRADTFRWTTSQPTVAAVSAAGVVRGLAAGRSVITVGVVARPSVQASALVEVRAP